MFVVSVEVRDTQVLYTWQCPCTLKGVALHALYSSVCTYIHMYVSTYTYGIRLQNTRGAAMIPSSKDDIFSENILVVNATRKLVMITP